MICHPLSRICLSSINGSPGTVSFHSRCTNPIRRGMKKRHSFCCPVSAGVLVDTLRCATLLFTVFHCRPRGNGDPFLHTHGFLFSQEWQHFFIHALR